MSATAEAVPREGVTSTSPRFSSKEIARFKQRDNYTNFYYIAIIYAVIAVTAILAVSVFEAYRAGDIGFGWVLLAAAFAALSMGASQHQFGAVIHEATHYALFENRKLNELAADWLAGFAIFTSTQAYRLHHFAHHQFVNDPDRDPIATQATESGHWLDFPVTHLEFLNGFLRLIWPVNSIRYIISRARHSSMPNEANPYFDEEARPNAWAVRVAILFIVGVPLVLVALIASGAFAAAGLVLGGAWLLATAYYLLIPEQYFQSANIRPVISERWTTIGRVTYAALLYGALTLAEFATGAPVWGYYALLWILPLLTTFPAFMVLREWIQHGNADRGRYTNTRVFLTDPISRYAIFPLGMDYHLPHHLFASVPHYRLKDLHERLLKEPQYKQHCRLVEGWTGDNEGRPGIIEVLGPHYAAKGTEIAIDEDALERADIRDQALIKEQVEASRHGRIW